MESPMPTNVPSPAARAGRRGLVPALLPLGAMLGSITALGLGTSFAKHLFPLIGAQGTTALRVALSALFLQAVWRPWRFPLSRRDAGAVLLYGAVLGTMNLLFYLSLRTIPLGIAIAIEFTGPLTVALAFSRRRLDLVWVVLAGLGLALLLPLGGAASRLDPDGVACALGAALCWALYIVFGKRVAHLHGGQAVALGMSVAALVVVPFGVAEAGLTLLDPAILAYGLGIALLSSALPYSLEMVALKRLTPQSFGVVLSLEPAVGALAAFAILGEHLTPLEALAAGAIVVASVGSALTAAPAAVPPP